MSDSVLLEKGRRLVQKTSRGDGKKNYYHLYCGRNFVRSSTGLTSSGGDGERNMQVGGRFTGDNTIQQEVRQFHRELNTPNTPFGKLTLLTSARVYVALCRRGRSEIHEQLLRVVGFAPLMTGTSRPGGLEFSSTVGEFLDAALGTTDYWHMTHDAEHYEPTLKRLRFRHWDQLLAYLPDLEQAFLKVTAVPNADHAGRELLMANFYMRLVRWEVRGFDARQKFVSNSVATGYDECLSWLPAQCMDKIHTYRTTPTEERMVWLEIFMAETGRLLDDYVPFAIPHAEAFREMTFGTADWMNIETYVSGIACKTETKVATGISKTIVAGGMYLAAMEKKYQNEFRDGGGYVVTPTGHKRHMGAGFYALSVLCSDNFFILDKVRKSETGVGRWLPTYDKERNCNRVEEDLKNAKKFLIAVTALPLELQTIICSMAGRIANPQEGSSSSLKLPKADVDHEFKMLGYTLSAEDRCYVLPNYEDAQSYIQVATSPNYTQDSPTYLIPVWDDGFGINEEEGEGEQLEANGDDLDNDDVEEDEEDGDGGGYDEEDVFNLVGGKINGSEDGDHHRPHPYARGDLSSSSNSGRDSPGPPSTKEIFMELTPKQLDLVYNFISDRITIQDLTHMIMEKVPESLSLPQLLNMNRDTTPIYLDIDLLEKLRTERLPQCTAKGQYEYVPPGFQMRLAQTIGTLLPFDQQIAEWCSCTTDPKAHDETLNFLKNIPGKNDVTMMMTLAKLCLNTADGLFKKLGRESFQSEHFTPLQFAILAMMLHRAKKNDFNVPKRDSDIIKILSSDGHARYEKKPERYNTLLRGSVTMRYFLKQNRDKITIEDFFGPFDTYKEGDAINPYVGRFELGNLAHLGWQVLIDRFEDSTFGTPRVTLSYAQGVKSLGDWYPTTDADYLLIDPLMKKMKAFITHNDDERFMLFAQMHMALTRFEHFHGKVKITSGVHNSSLTDVTHLSFPRDRKLFRVLQPLKDHLLLGGMVGDLASLHNPHTPTHAKYELPVECLDSTSVEKIRVEFIKAYRPNIGWKALSQSEREGHEKSEIMDSDPTFFARFCKDVGRYDDDDDLKSSPTRLERLFAELKISTADATSIVWECLDPYFVPNHSLAGASNPSWFILRVMLYRWYVRRQRRLPERYPTDEKLVELIIQTGKSLGKGNAGVSYVINSLAKSSGFVLGNIDEYAFPYLSDMNQSMNVIPTRQYPEGTKNEQVWQYILLGFDMRVTVDPYYRITNHNDLDNTVTHAEFRTLHLRQSQSQSQKNLTSAQLSLRILGRERVIYLLVDDIKSNQQHQADTKPEDLKKIYLVDSMPLVRELKAVFLSKALDQPILPEPVVATDAAEAQLALVGDTFYWDMVPEITPPNNGNDGEPLDSATGNNESGGTLKNGDDGDASAAVRSEEDAAVIDGWEDHSMDTSDDDDDEGLSNLVGGKFDKEEGRGRPHPYAHPRMNLEVTPSSSSNDLIQQNPANDVVVVGISNPPPPPISTTTLTEEQLTVIDSVLCNTHVRMTTFLAIRVPESLALRQLREDKVASEYTLVTGEVTRNERLSQCIGTAQITSQSKKSGKKITETIGIMHPFDEQFAIWCCHTSDPKAHTDIMSFLRDIPGKDDVTMMNTFTHLMLDTADNVLKCDPTKHITFNSPNFTLLQFTILIVMHSRTLIMPMRDSDLISIIVDKVSDNLKSDNYTTMIQASLPPNITKYLEVEDFFGGEFSDFEKDDEINPYMGRFELGSMAHLGWQLILKHFESRLNELRSISHKFAMTVKSLGDFYPTSDRDFKLIHHLLSPMESAIPNSVKDHRARLYYSFIIMHLSLKRFEKRYGVVVLPPGITSFFSKNETLASTHGDMFRVKPIIPPPEIDHATGKIMDLALLHSNYNKKNLVKTKYELPVECLGEHVVTQLRNYFLLIFRANIGWDALTGSEQDGHTKPDTVDSPDFLARFCKLVGRLDSTHRLEELCAQLGITTNATSIMYECLEPNHMSDMYKRATDPLWFILRIMLYRWYIRIRRSIPTYFLSDSQEINLIIHLGQYRGGNQGVRDLVNSLAYSSGYVDSRIDHYAFPFTNENDPRADGIRDNDLGVRTMQYPKGTKNELIWQFILLGFEMRLTLDPRYRITKRSDLETADPVDGHPTGVARVTLKEFISLQTVGFMANDEAYTAKMLSPNILNRERVVYLLLDDTSDGDRVTRSRPNHLKKVYLQDSQKWWTYYHHPLSTWMLTWTKMIKALLLSAALEEDSFAHHLATEDEDENENGDDDGEEGVGQVVYVSPGSLNPWNDDSDDDDFADEENDDDHLQHAPDAHVSDDENALPNNDDAAAAMEDDDDIPFFNLVGAKDRVRSTRTGAPNMMVRTKEQFKELKPWSVKKLVIKREQKTPDILPQSDLSLDHLRRRNLPPIECLTTEDLQLIRTKFIAKYRENIDHNLLRPYEQMGHLPNTTWNKDGHEEDEDDDDNFAFWFIADIGNGEYGRVNELVHELGITTHGNLIITDTLNISRPNPSPQHTLLRLFMLRWVRLDERKLRFMLTDSDLIDLIIKSTTKADQVAGWSGRYPEFSHLSSLMAITGYVWNHVEPFFGTRTDKSREMDPANGFYLPNTRDEQLWQIALLGFEMTVNIRETYRVKDRTDIGGMDPQKFILKGAFCVVYESDLIVTESPILSVPHMIYCEGLDLYENRPKNTELVMIPATKLIALSFLAQRLRVCYVPSKVMPALNPATPANFVGTKRTDKKKGESDSEEDKYNRILANLQIQLLTIQAANS